MMKTEKTEVYIKVIYNFLVKAATLWSWKDSKLKQREKLLKTL